MFIISKGIETFQNMKGIEMVQNMGKVDFSQQFQIEMQDRPRKEVLNPSCCHLI